MNQLWHGFNRCISEPRARLGWILVVIGLIAWQMFGRHANWPGLIYFRGPLERTDGVVVKSVSSGFSIGDEPGVPIREVRFTFLDRGGVEREGTSWSEGVSPRAGDQVQIEFVARDPSWARIVGWRSRPLPCWVVTVVLFPLLGAWCILRAFLGFSPS